MSRGTDRNADRVDLSFLEALETRAEELSKGDDIYCLPPAATSRRPRITAARLAALGRSLSDRDRQILTSLRKYRLATTAQLQTLHFADHASLASGGRVARRVLARLHDLQLVLRLQRRIGGIRAGSAGQVYALSPIGYRLLGEQQRKRTWEPSFHHLQHTLAITELATQLKDLERTGTYSIDSLQAEPTCWRSPTNGPKQTLKPDLFTRISADDVELSWFIEIDLATESTKVLQSKLATYTAYWSTDAEQRHHGVFPKVLWVAPDLDRCRQIAEAIATGRAIEPRLFDVALNHQALNVLTDF